MNQAYFPFGYPPLFIVGGLIYVRTIGGIAVKNIQTILILSIAGFLFSGYLTAVKLFSGSCPLTDGCTYFLGFPSCLWGFLMFGTILVSAFLYMRAGKSEERKKYHSIFQTVSGIGILFAGYYAFNEIFFPSCLIQPCTYTLILPSCAYGLVMYALIFYFAWKMKKE